MSQRQIFKITILSPDIKLFDDLNEVFGVDFEKAKTETSGASFSYSHFHVEDEQRLTAQFWMLDASPQWISIRNLYLKGASGIFVLHEPTMKNAEALNRRLLKEFISANRFPVPIILLHLGEKDNLVKTKQFANDIERWAGYAVRVVSSDSDDLDDLLNQYMIEVRDWRARNVIFQTLKLYFSIDSITNTKRGIHKIISQLRRIYTSGYYELLSDAELFVIVQQAIILEGFQYDADEKCILYEKEIQKNPWGDVEAKLGPNEFNKPSVEKMD